MTNFQEKHSFYAKNQTNTLTLQQPKIKALISDNYNATKVRHQCEQ
jgi:hypothetical protein